MFVRVHTTLKMSVLLLTPTGNCVHPRQCASTSTSPPATGAVPTMSPTALSSSPATPARFLSLANEARSKVQQLSRHQKPFVFSPIDIDRLKLNLADPRDRNFVFNLLTTLKEGARIGYLVPTPPHPYPTFIVTRRALSPKNTYVNGVLYITSLTPRAIASTTISPKTPTLSAMYGSTALLILFSPWEGEHSWPRLISNQPSA